jgi:aspartate/methionine/tyrosine aminotransferase
MYVYADVSELSSEAYRFADELLEHAHVAVVPWDKRHIRLAYGNSYDNLKTALERIGEALVT